MHFNLIKGLLEQLDRIQEILIDVATGVKIQELENEYSNLLDQVEIKVEILKEEGFLASYPKPFEDLWKWYHYYKDNQYKQAQRGKFIYDYYDNFCGELELEIGKDFLADTLDFSSEQNSKSEGIRLILNNIEKLSEHLTGLVRPKSFVDEIQARDPEYKRIRRFTLIYLNSFDFLNIEVQKIDVPRSLWQCYGLFQGEINFPSDREKYIEKLFRDLRKIISKYLMKISVLDSDPDKFSKGSLGLSKVESVKTPVLQATSNSISLSQTLISSSKEILVDFAILTAIEVERIAICQALDIDLDADRKFEASRVYWYKQLLLPNGENYSIIVAQCSDMANIDAALLASDTLHHWKPAAIIMVGIAAAISHEQQLGDLVLGREVYYYERGKQVSSGKLPEFKMHNADPRLWSRVQALPETVKHSFHILADRPDGDNQRPRIYPGVIASGEEVIANSNIRDEISSSNRKIKAIEMEGYGVSRAAWQSSKPCLVIRTLCDYADGEKNDTWHEYAAAVAAGFTKHFLLDMPLEPRNG